MKDFMLNFDISAITFELKKELIDKYIDNVYHLNPKTIMLKIKPGPLYLILEASKRVHITKYKLKTPSKPINFVMALRKHLSRGKIIDIIQPEFERIIEFAILSKGKKYRFIVEIFKRGNIILVNEEGFILAALRLMIMKDRKIIINKQYVPAPSDKKNLTRVGRKDLEELKANEEVILEKALTNLLAIDRTYTKELLSRSKLEGSIKLDEISDKQIDSIYGTIEELRNKISRGPDDPAIIFDNGDQIDVIPVSLKIYEAHRKRHFKSFNEAADEYFSSILTQEEKSQEENKLSKRAEELNRILNNQHMQLESFKKAIEINRKKGEIIYLHLNEIEQLSHQIISSKEAGYDWKDIETMIKQESGKGKKPEIYFQKIVPHKLEYTIKIDNIDLAIGLKNKPQYWASQSYDKAKKIEEKLIGLESSIENIKKKMRSLEDEKTQILRELPQLNKRREKLWYEKFRWFESSSGFLVLCGRDASNNELLVKKYMDAKDIVLHAEIHGAPFAVIKTNGKDIDERTIEEAATFAACYSKAWVKGFSSIDLYWVKPDQVSKMPPSGQYLAKGMFMIRGKKNYIKGITLRLAIGVIKKDSQAIIVSGPITAIKDKAISYVELSPGKKQSGELMKKIKKTLIMKASNENKESIQRIDLNELQALIPSGKADIV